MNIIWTEGMERSFEVKFGRCGCQVVCAECACRSACKVKAIKYFLGPKL